MTSACFLVYEKAKYESPRGETGEKLLKQITYGQAELLKSRLDEIGVLKEDVFQVSATVLNISQD